MKIPYITLHVDKNRRPKFIIGFGVYTFNKYVKGCTLWCDKFKNFIRLYKYC